jgi:predicted DNA-binding transcriptional regulator AlpA
MTDQPEALSIVLKQLLNKLSTTETQSISAYMDTKQAAAYLGLSKQFLEIARHRGDGPKYYKLSQAVRYSKADLDEFMSMHKKQHTAEGVCHV